MNRLARSVALAGVVAGASLASACASNPADPYAHTMRPRLECPTGSHICREVDSRTGRARTAHPVVVIQVNGQRTGESVGALLNQLPFVY